VAERGLLVLGHPSAAAIFAGDGRHEIPLTVDLEHVAEVDEIMQRVDGGLWEAAGAPYAATA